MLRIFKLQAGISSNGGSSLKFLHESLLIIKRIINPLEICSLISTSEFFVLPVFAKVCLIEGELCAMAAAKTLILAAFLIGLCSFFR